MQKPGFRTNPADYRSYAWHFSPYVADGMVGSCYTIVSYLSAWMLFPDHPIVRMDEMSVGNRSNTLSIIPSLLMCELTLPYHRFEQGLFRYNTRLVNSYQMAQITLHRRQHRMSAA